jgi:hypothetical protein
MFRGMFLSDILCDVFGPVLLFSPKSDFESDCSSLPWLEIVHQLCNIAPWWIP